MSIPIIYPFSQAFCPNGTSKSRTLPDSYACAEAKSLGAFWFLGPSVLWWLGGEWFHGDNRGPLRSTYLWLRGRFIERGRINVGGISNRMLMRASFKLPMKSVYMASNIAKCKWYTGPLHFSEKDTLVLQCIELGVRQAYRNLDE